MRNLFLGLQLFKNSRGMMSSSLKLMGHILGYHYFCYKVIGGQLAKF